MATALIDAVAVLGLPFSRLLLLSLSFSLRFRCSALVSIEAPKSTGYSVIILACSVVFIS
jgi:hypothetical protein